MKRPLLIVVSVVVVALALTAYSQIRNWNHSDSTRETKESGPRDHVQLNEDKFHAAEIKVMPVTRREMRSQRTVPGHIEYNATRHVEIKSPFDGLIRQIDVKVGDRVVEGQVMAIVDSPELGEKRADVLQRMTDLEQARIDYDWWNSVRTNLDDLLGRLKRDHQPQAMVQLEKDFADKPLGDYREQILGAYAQLRLDKMRTLENSKEGDFAQNEKNQRETARNKSAAKFVAVSEQATIDVKKQTFQAESVMKNAERRLAVAKQRLGLLVGQSQDAIPNETNDADLSRWPVKAPFTGHVEEILLAPKERILMSHGLFQLADTSRLWVQADIRERDWPALSITAGQKISVQTPALPDKTLEATVSFIGPAVVPETRAVPLIADIDNSDGLLRPLMFVRVLLPDGESRECVAVPQSAITTNDGRTFVFIETGPREYYPRDVIIGLSVEPWVEITSGLEPGERVVTSGAAILKAELILEAEE